MKMTLIVDRVEQLQQLSIEAVNQSRLNLKRKLQN